MAKANNAAAKAPASKGEPAALVAIEPIRLDGVDVAPGEAFDAAPDVATTLLASGAARQPD